MTGPSSDGRYSVRSMCPLHASSASAFSNAAVSGLGSRPIDEDFAVADEAGSDRLMARALLLSPGDPMHGHYLIDRVRRHRYQEQRSGSLLVLARPKVQPELRDDAPTDGCCARIGRLPRHSYVPGLPV